MHSTSLNGQSSLLPSPGKKKKFIARLVYAKTLMEGLTFFTPAPISFGWNSLSVMLYKNVHFETLIY